MNYICIPDNNTFYEWLRCWIRDLGTDPICCHKEIRIGPQKYIRIMKSQTVKASLYPASLTRYMLNIGEKKVDLLYTIFLCW